jgi:hypothetical protein
MKGIWVALFFGTVIICQALRADEAELDRLHAAKELWSSAQDGNYRYSYRKYCDCYRGQPPTTVISVGRGRIERVVNLFAGIDNEVPAREDVYDIYWTVDELFAKLEAAYASNVTVRVEYAPDFGYPESIYIDYVETMIGDETDLRQIAVEID